jgi:hypothetical protein
MCSQKSLSVSTAMSIPVLTGLFNLIIKASFHQDILGVLDQRFVCIVYLVVLAQLCPEK